MHLASDHALTDDGTRLPLYRHLPVGTPRGVVLALHGFGDHAGAFRALADILADVGIALYAYDQRGFGATASAGHWAGTDTLVEDARAMAGLLRTEHPDTPLFLLGESMGGAVSLLAVTGAPTPPLEGLVLLAPAVWGRRTMPWYQRLGLAMLAPLLPGLRISRRMARRLGIEPTDDPGVRRELEQDPRVQRHFRLDVIDGLGGLMDSALATAGRLSVPTLLLYGERDQVIPPPALCALLRQLPAPDAPPWRLALYPDGYHMLTRCTGAARVQRDLAAWLLDTCAALPSGLETAPQAALARLCPH